MKLFSRFKSMFKSEKKLDTATIESIPVFKTETPTKIIETRIKPVKIPTIVDVGEKLGFISREIIELKNEIVTKSWFRSEYEDTGDEVINRLLRIENALVLLQKNIKQLNEDLSKFTKYELTEMPYRVDVVGIPNQILEIIKKRGRVRYKDLNKSLSISDPTLSKYLKILTKTNKINRIKFGKAVYYELITV